ncbi:MAG: PQQ-binding-like beta-propeller repeat protein [Planctomyces sp.]
MKSEGNQSSHQAILHSISGLYSGRRGFLRAAAGSLATLSLSGHALNGQTLSLSGTSAAAAQSINGVQETSTAGQETSAPGTADSAVKQTGWISYRGTPDQRGISFSALADQPEQKWEFPSADGWVSSVAIVGDRVYAPALEGYLYCLDRKTGQEIWKYRTIDNADPKTFAPGFKAAPLVSGGVVYVGDEDGVLHAVSADSGQRQWKFATGAEIAGCVGQFGDQLLLSSHDSFLYCLSQQGEELWKFQTQDMVNCSPAIAEHFTFLAGCDGHLRVIDLNTHGEVHGIPMESPLIASPSIVGDQLYVGTHAGEIVSVNWRKGEVTWRYKGPRDMPYHASGAVTDEIVVVGSHDKHLHAVDRLTGKGLWTFPTKARIESSCTVVDQRVFFGSGDGNIYGVDLKSGKQVWKVNPGKPVNAGIAIGEGCLIVGEEGQNGRLRCFA